MLAQCHRINLLKAEVMRKPVTKNNEKILLRWVLALMISLCAPTYSITLNAQTKNERNTKHKVMTEKEFTELFIKSLSGKYQHVKYKIIDDLTIEANHNGDVISHYLDNAY
jgi:hypothetical protein